jgi:cytochrome c553
MPRHIARLLLLLVVFAVLAYGAKRFFTADSFYEYGHYRGKSVAEIAAAKPKYKGTAYCTACHAQQVAEWSSGVHNSIDVGKVVKCEVCHGPAGGRDNELGYVPATTGPEHPKNLKMTVPTDSRKLCTLCHERMTGRPLQQRQIVVADHAGTQQCTVCHNPHSPRLNLVSATTTVPAGNAAAGKAKAAVCAGCHGADGVSKNLPGPTLANQHDAYIVGAIKAYATGARVEPMMSAVAKMSDDDAANLAAYFGGLKCESALTAEKQTTLPGHTIAAKCRACHGANGVSTNPSWPNLVGQSKAYLVSALKRYSSGARKNAIMAGIAKGLSDAELDNVAAYYAAATCK